jgi:peptidyl-prolyl cis-trans isomerase SurA
MLKAGFNSGRRLGLAGTAALAGVVWAQAAIVPALRAQVVKAPRYQGGVEAPTPQLNLPPLPPAITPHGTVVEDVVARVNDQIISRSDVERAEEQLQQEAAQNHMNAGDLALAQRDMLRDMIDEQLLLSKAKELGLNADADVIRQLDEIRKKNNMASLDELAAAAKAQGVNFEDFKAQIRNQILKQEVVRDEVGRKLQMSDAEEKSYYQAHLNDFQQPEQVRLSEILVPLPETATPDQVAQGETKANEIKTKIMQGGNFAELAKKYSGGPSAVQGGELGLWKRGALAPVLENAVFPLKVGETTQPIRTRQGWLIMQVTEHDVAGPKPMKDVEPQIQEALYMQAMQPALRTYLTKLREDSYVNLAPGFVDSGASADETVPVFTAYAPPPVKKKKPKDTQRFTGNARYQTVSARKPVASSPDTNGRTITGPDAKPAVDLNTGMAVIAPVKTASVTAKGSKGYKKVKKEKIRFGQAPRNALPGGGPDEVAGATDAPGAVMASTGTSAAAATDSASANLEDNPLTPKAPEQKKTRFAATEKVVKEKKIATLSAKKQDKILATAAPMTDEEKANAAQQAAPLGLNGDVVKQQKQAKKDKKKKKKDAPKVRLADQPPAPKVAPVAPAPTANPNLAPTNLPPATAPAAPPS